MGWYLDRMMCQRTNLLLVKVRLIEAELLVEHS